MRARLSRPLVCVCALGCGTQEGRSPRLDGDAISDTAPTAADTRVVDTGTVDTSAIDTAAVDTGLVLDTDGPLGVLDTDCEEGDAVAGGLDDPARKIAGELSWFAASDVRIDGSYDYQYFGAGLSPEAGDVNGDGVNDLLVTSAGPQFYGSDNTSGTHVILGPLEPGILPEDEVTVVQIASVSDIGDASMLDIDLDGVHEVVVAEYFKSYVEHVAPLPEPGITTVAALDSLLTISGTNYFTPPRHAGVVDADGDGAGDLWLADAMGEPESTVRLHLGPLAGDLGAAVPAAEYTQSGYRFGEAIDHGDLDGDGTSDLAIATAVRTADDPETGVFLVTSPALVVADILDVASTWFQSPTDGAQTARVAGDLDLDGYEDVAFGQSAPYGDESAALIVQYGPPPAGTFLPSCASSVVVSDPPEGNILRVEPGDYDGDGFADLAAGRATGSDDVFEVHVLYGPIPTGVLDLSYAGAVVTQPGGHRNAGDVSGDGVDDLVFADVDSSPDASLYTGAVFVLYGGTL